MADAADPTRPDRRAPAPRAPRPARGAAAPGPARAGRRAAARGDHRGAGRRPAGSPGAAPRGRRHRPLRRRAAIVRRATTSPSRSPSFLSSWPPSRCRPPRDWSWRWSRQPPSSCPTPSSRAHVLSALEVVELLAFAVVSLALRLVVVRLSHGRAEIDRVAADLGAMGAQVDEARESTERWVAQLEVAQRAAARMAGRASVGDVAATVVDEVRAIVDYHACRVYVVAGARRPGPDRGRRRQRLRDDRARGASSQGGRGLLRLGRRQRAAAPGPRRQRGSARGHDPGHRRGRGVDARRPDALRRAGHRRDHALQAGPPPVRPGRRAHPLDPGRPGRHGDRIGAGDQRLGGPRRGPAPDRGHEQRPLAQPGPPAGGGPDRPARRTRLRGGRVRDLLVGPGR